MPTALAQKCSNEVLRPAEAPASFGRAPMRADELSFDAFFRRYYPLALNYLYRRLRNRELAEELVESAFVRLLPAAGKLDGNNCTAWVYRVVVNELRRHLRAERARGRLYDRFREWKRARLARGAASEPETLDFDAVSAALSHLDEKYAAVLSLRYFEGLSMAEIAAVFNASEATVRGRLWRGLRQLRAHLGIRLPASGYPGETR